MTRSPLVVAALASAAAAASLSDLCTVANVQASLPANGTVEGLSLLPDTVSVAIANSSSSTSSGGFRKRDDTSTSYCNVTVSYTHTNKSDTVVVWYGFPDPSVYANRFYVGGGGGYSLASGVTGGLTYGAVTGCTDAGYDAFTNSLDEVVLNTDGSLNWDAITMFSYQALGEMTVIGKQMTQAFYNTTDKVYTYFSGCSDGGREGMSQVQRWGDVYDGVVAGAPAFRQAQQQVNHLFPAVVEETLNYNPEPCELEEIVTLIIDACDPLDGRTDGVISRSDLCLLNFNLSSTIGSAYYCAAENSTSLGYGFSRRSARDMVRRAQTSGSSTSYTPAQNGTISAEGVAVAQAIVDGLFTSDGKRAYLSWQIGSAFSDGETTYNSTTGTYEVPIESTGGVFVTKFLEQVDLDNLETLTGVTYDQLAAWMTEALPKFYDTLQTTYVNLTDFQSSGAKLLHYHGESDPSVPAPSSIHYYDAVRTAMYPDSGYNASVAALSDWYRFFLIPGAAHCGTNTLQPGPWPNDLVQTMIDWVENGVAPDRLNSTVASGDYEGETQLLCQWPERPLWPSNDSTTFDCVYDQASIDSWIYTFDAYNVTVN